MSNSSHFIYVNSLPTDAVKVEKIRERLPVEFYYSYNQNKFYSKFLDSQNQLKRIRECVPNKNGLVFARDSLGKGICVTVNKFRHDFATSHGLSQPTPRNIDSQINYKELLYKINRISRMVEDLKRTVEYKVSEDETNSENTSETTSDSTTESITDSNTDSTESGNSDSTTSSENNSDKTSESSQDLHKRLLLSNVAKKD